MNSSLLPVSIVMNTKSGHQEGRPEFDIQQVVQQFITIGMDVQLFLAGMDDDILDCINTAVTRHMCYPIAQRGMIVAAGGDGTINSVVQAILGKHIQLGILPLGTFNYVAKVLNIPLDLAEAVHVLLQDHHQSIHLAQVNDRIYLNNASIGLYPIIIESREYYNARLGRFRSVAYLSGLVELIKPFYHYKLKMIIDGESFPIESPMVFFGNNQLQLQDLKLKLADCAAKGKLAGVALAKVNRFQLLQLMVKLLKGELEQADDVHIICADRVEIRSKKHKLKVALDGEVCELATPLKFTMLHHAVDVRVPKHATSSV